MEFPNLYCLTSDRVNLSHSNQVEMMCKKGVRLIQFRTKTLGPEFLKNEAKRAVEISGHYETTLIINDFVKISSLLNASGVHLGKDDQLPDYARKKLGSEKLIGETVHLLTEAKAVKDRGVADYVGIGPYRNSETKNSLTSILSDNEYSEISGLLGPIPRYLIGGLDSNDFSLIKKLNLTGICVCSALSEGREFGIHLSDILLEANKNNQELVCE